MKSIVALILTYLFAINASSQAIIVDHLCTKLDSIPENAIIQAKNVLHIAYGHTSHGSQLIEGMTELENWKGQPYAWNDGQASGQLDIDDYFVSGDLGNPDRTTWESLTRSYLALNPDVNVVMWSWCGQVSSATEQDIVTYLNLMNGLETSYPNIKFVYMTGHLDGSGINGNLHQRNQQIRNYCQNNNKILFDFADIESWDPDGNFYLDKAANDNCDYDNDGNGTRESNWATAWQSSHVIGTDWFDCSPAHSQPLNGNLKAYASWWLWARLSGWNGVTSINKTNYYAVQDLSSSIYPNPIKDKAKLDFVLTKESITILRILDATGKEIMQVPFGKLNRGKHEYLLNLPNIHPGTYIYEITANNIKNSKAFLVK